jgi:CBS-domain-containing membrane protein
MTTPNIILRGWVEESRSIVTAGLGGFALVLLLGQISKEIELPLLLGSFGASCVLVFGFPDLPFS